MVEYTFVDIVKKLSIKVVKSNIFNIIKTGISIIKCMGESQMMGKN